jgi:hypothetical protein
MIARPPISEDVWDALARGELSDEELGTLKALAESDEEVATRLAAFTPVGPEFQSRAVASIVAKRRQRRLRAWWAPSLLVAAAAAVLLVLASRPDPDGEMVTNWSVEVIGGARTVRGDEPTTEVPRFLPDTRLEIRMRPPERTEEEVQVAAFLVSGAREEVRPWSPPLERADTGAVRIAGPAAELLEGVPPGRWTIAIALGTHLPDDEVLRAWARGRDPRLELTEIEILEPEAAR